MTKKVFHDINAGNEELDKIHKNIQKHEIKIM